MSQNGQSSYSGNQQPFTPYNVYGNIGNTQISGNNISSTLNPAWQQTYQNLLNQGNSFMNLGGYAPPTQNQFIKGYQTSAGTPSGPAPVAPTQSQFMKTVQGQQSGMYGDVRGPGGYGPPQQVADTAAYQKAMDAYNSQLAQYNQGSQSQTPIYDTQAYNDALAKYNSNGGNPQDQIYAKLTEQAKPGQDAAYADLESRLQAQGRLGVANGNVAPGATVGSNPEMQSFFTAAQQADLSRQIQAMTLAPQIMSAYQGLQNNAIGAAQSITGQQAQQGNLSMGLGSTSGGYANTAAGLNMNATLGNNATQAAFWGPIANNVGLGAKNYVNNNYQSWNVGQPADYGAQNMYVGPPQ
jgi:hypothetical protein